MKKRVLIGVMSAMALGMGLSSCDAMLESSLDVPLGYGGNIGVSVSNYIPLVNGWSNWGYGGLNGLGWFPIPGPGVGPVVTPVRPALRPGSIAPAPPVNNVRPPINNNWRPPVTNNQPPISAPNRPGTTNSTINYRPVNSLPQGSSYGRH